MKKITTIFLLSAGMLLSLVGCQEKPVSPDGTKEGTPVEFAAVSGNPATRTAYSGEGEGTAPNLTWERIDWLEGDQVLMWSDKATSKSGSGHSAVYSILSVTKNGKESLASISDPSETGLRYAEEGGAHKFWGLYPASAVSSAPAEGSESSLSFNIPATQDGEKSVDSNGNITYTPDMDLAVMLAAIEGAQPKEKVNIYFYPAFTAFELTFSVDPTYQADVENPDPVILHHVTLSSESSNLVGTVAATIATGTRTFTATGTDNYAFTTADKVYTVGASTYTAGTDAAKTVTFTLPEPVELAKGKELKLTIVTLPNNIEDLTIGMGMGEDGSDVRNGKLKIKTGTDGSVKKNLAFAACQKHNIRGVLLRPNDWEFSSITTKLQVLEWEPVTINGDSEDFPQATQLSIGGDGVKNGDSDLHLNGTAEDRVKDPYRQQWYFMPGQTVTVFMKVMLPAGGSWEFVPVGGSEDNLVEGDAALFTVKNVSPAIDDQHPTVATQLWGPIRETGSTTVNLEITYNGTDSEVHSFYFHTYVYSGPNRTGTKFNIDSETQLYDRGRGYHTFIVNSPNYQNN